VPRRRRVRRTERGVDVRGAGQQHRHVGLRAEDGCEQRAQADDPLGGVAAARVGAFEKKVVGAGLQQDRDGLVSVL
jgi:hypothetical protein